MTEHRSPGRIEIGSLRDKDEPRVGAEHLAQTPPHDRVIIGDDDPDLRGGRRR